MEDITVCFTEDFSKEELHSPILLEGLPGVGHVGKLVAEHMIRELGAEKIAEIHSIYFPPQVIIEDDGVVRLANNELYLFRNDSHQILFLVGDFQATSNEGHYILSDVYLEIAADLGVSRIYTLGGFGVGHLVEEPRVLAAVNRPELREEVIRAGGIFGNGEPVGGIVGAAGLLLGLCREKGIDGICLMGETSGYLVDPMSATSLLKVLTTLIGIEIDASTLRERSLEMEKMVQKLIEGEQGSQDDELRYIG